jgi:hypothetical protein
MAWQKLTSRQFRQFRLLTRNIRTQPLYDNVLPEEPAASKPPAFGLATPREVLFVVYGLATSCC